MEITAKIRLKPIYLTGAEPVCMTWGHAGPWRRWWLQTFPGCGAQQTPATRLCAMLNKERTVIKPAHLEIALSVAPRLNQMSEICSGLIKVMWFTILSAPGSYSTLRSPVKAHTEKPRLAPAVAPVAPALPSPNSHHPGAH